MTKSEKILSILAIFIAVLALVTSIWQGIEDRRHNRFSVRPLLNFEILNKNDSIRSISLTNNGLGPAIIENFSIHNKDHVWTSADGNPWYKVAKAYDLLDKYTWMWYYGKGNFIKVEEFDTPFSYKVDTSSIEYLDIRVKIKYSSIYGEKFELDGGF